jgi:transcription-repair coupling factor (superfamily II helicase)
LKALEEFSDLGSGFNLALRDLDLRGAGNLLGGEQSGFISEIGFEMYQKILDEAIRELKQDEFRDLFAGEAAADAADCQVESDLEILIPSSYVESAAERLNLYRALDDLKDEQALRVFAASLADRFGPVPAQVEALFDTLRLRWQARALGFEKITLRRGVLRGQFAGDQQAPFFQTDRFARILQYVQTHPVRVALREAKGRLMLTVAGVATVAGAHRLLVEMGGEAMQRPGAPVAGEAGGAKR